MALSGKLLGHDPLEDILAPGTVEPTFGEVFKAGLPDYYKPEEVPFELRLIPRTMDRVFKEAEAKGYSVFYGENGAESPLEFGTRLIEQLAYPESRKPHGTISKEEANSQFGIPGYLDFKEDVPYAVAQSLQEKTLKHIRQVDVADRLQGFFDNTAGFGLDMLSLMADPFMQLSLVFPVIPEEAIGEMALTRILGKYGPTASRALAGTTEATTGLIIGELPDVVSHRLETGEWGGVNLAQDLMFGGVFGAIVRPLVGKLSDKLDAWAMRDLENQVRSRLNETVNKDVDEIIPDQPLSRPDVQVSERSNQAITMEAMRQAADGDRIDVQGMHDLARALESEERQKNAPDPLVEEPSLQETTVVEDPVTAKTQPKVTRVESITSREQEITSRLERLENQIAKASKELRRIEHTAKKEENTAGSVSPDTAGKLTDAQQKLTALKKSHAETAKEAHSAGVEISPMKRDSRYDYFPGTESGYAKRFNQIEKFYREIKDLFNTGVPTKDMVDDMQHLWTKLTHALTNDPGLIDKIRLAHNLGTDFEMSGRGWGNLLDQFRGVFRIKDDKITIPDNISNVLNKIGSILDSDHVLSRERLFKEFFQPEKKESILERIRQNKLSQSQDIMDVGERIETDPEAMARDIANRGINQDPLTASYIDDVTEELLTDVDSEIERLRAEGQDDLANSILENRMTDEELDKFGDSTEDIIDGNCEI